jgi:histidine triad (HIT) family protein
MQWLSKSKTYLFILLTLLLGVIIGGYLFSDTQPRSFLALHKCQDTCFQPKELVGLLSSAGIQKLPVLIPSVVMETEKTVVIEHPAPEARIHYLIFPKRDIRNISEVAEADGEYLVDAFRVVREIVGEKKLVNYRVVTNGPGYQGVSYLHFHLTAQ